MGDLNGRRGRIAGMDTRGASTVIRAQVPMSEMLTYEQHLTSVTGGRGSYHMEYSHYEDVPAPLQTKIVAAHKAAHPHAGDHARGLGEPPAWAASVLRYRLTTNGPGVRSAGPCRDRLGAAATSRRPCAASSIFFGGAARRLRRLARRAALGVLLLAADARGGGAQPLADALLRLRRVAGLGLRPPSRPRPSSGRTPSRPVRPAPSRRRRRGGGPSLQDAGVAARPLHEARRQVVEQLGDDVRR